jgi:hypothetical protein
MTGAPRKRGVSPAALILFIVIAVAALVVAYFIYTDKEDWRKKHEALAQEKSGLEESVRDLQAGLSGWEETAGLTFEGVKALLPGEGDTVVNLIRAEQEKARAAQSLAQSVGQDRQNLQKELEAQQKALQQAKEDHDKALKELDKKYQDHREQATADEEKLTKEIADVRQERLAAEGEVRATEDRMKELVAGHKADKLAWEVERTKLLMRLQAMRPPRGEEAVGQILRVNAMLGAATIDLGSRDRVRPGMIFEVYSETPGGERVSKGRVEAKTVGEWASVVALIDPDPQNPVVTGDNLVCPFVAREHPKFVVAGWFGPQLEYREPEIKALIQKWGGELQEQVEVDSDYLVIGEYRLPPTVTEEAAVNAANNGMYQLDAAKAFGIIILNVERFLDLVVR